MYEASVHTVQQFEVIVGTSQVTDLDGSDQNVCREWKCVSGIEKIFCGIENFLNSDDISEDFLEKIFQKSRPFVLDSSV